MLPRLLHERLDELGIDFAFVYPTFGLMVLSLDEAELRAAFARAFNAYYAEAYAGLGDRLCHAAIVPMHTPDEALAELEHAVGALGLRACVLAGHVLRPLPGAESRARRALARPLRRREPLRLRPGVAPLRGARRRADLPLERDGLGQPPLAHELRLQPPRQLRGRGRGHLPRALPARRAGALPAPALRLPRGRRRLGREPARGSLIGHLEKRGPARASRSLDPRALDRDADARALRALRAEALRARTLDELDAALAVLSDPGRGPGGARRVRALGCRAARTTSAPSSTASTSAARPTIRWCTTAFDAGREHARAARLRAILGSDIGHWDVPDVTRVLPEAWELVERGRLSEAQLRAFLFENPVSLFTGANPRFFEGTRVADAVRPFLPDLRAR